MDRPLNSLFYKVRNYGTFPYVYVKTTPDDKDVVLK